RDDGRDEMVRKIEAALAATPHLLDRTFHGDGTPVADEDTAHIYDVLAKGAVPLRWQPGDTLVLDNILTAHGRRTYSGERLFLTALIKTPPATAARRGAAAHGPTERVHGAA